MVTMRAGVIGHPISHSLSPRLHGRWIEAFGLNARYDAVDGESVERFPSLIHELVDAGWSGLNVTIPFKGEALALADEVSDTARALGAVNLLMFKGGRIIGDNTDWIGFTAAVENAGWGGPRGRALVLGAGGAAPAILHGLRQLGYETVSVSNRTRDKAETLAARFDGVDVQPWETKDTALGDVDLLVNTTSLGMKGQPPLEIELTALPGHAGVVDIVTTPLETPLLTAARARGLQGMNGVPMLVHQAIPSFAAWFGKTPEDPDAAIAYLEEALSRR